MISNDSHKAWNPKAKSLVLARVCEFFSSPPLQVPVRMLQLDTEIRMMCSYINMYKYYTQIWIVTTFSTTITIFFKLPLA